MGGQQRIDKKIARLAASLVGYALELEVEDMLLPERRRRELVRAR